MPNKTSKKKPAAALPSIPKELIDQNNRGLTPLLQKSGLN